MLRRQEKIAVISSVVRGANDKVTVVDLENLETKGVATSSSSFDFVLKF